MFFTASSKPPTPTPISVNYFPSRDCNKACGFCFHTAKNSYMATLTDAKRGIAALHAAGMRKLNVAGGEPFLHPKFLGELCRFAKQDLGLESVSIVSNGSLIKERWLREYGRWVDILAISCDSFDEATNVKIGRGNGKNVEELRGIARWCGEYGIMFKLNTVVCRYNFEEDMSALVEELMPFRWKVFQVLLVQVSDEASFPSHLRTPGFVTLVFCLSVFIQTTTDRRQGENHGSRTDGEALLRNAANFQISTEEYNIFCEKHKHLPCFIPESNKIMAQSYLLLDEVRYASSSPRVCASHD